MIFKLFLTQSLFKIYGRFVIKNNYDTRYPRTVTVLIFLSSNKGGKEMYNVLIPKKKELPTSKKGKKRDTTF